MNNKANIKIEDIIKPQKDIILFEKNLIRETESGIVLIDKFNYVTEGEIKQGTSSISPDPVYKVLAIGPDVTTCKAGDFIMLTNGSGATHIDLLEEDRHFMTRDLYIAFVVDPMYKKVQQEYKKTKEEESESLKEKAKKQIIN